MDDDVLKGIVLIVGYLLMYVVFVCLNNSAWRVNRDDRALSDAARKARDATRL